jgi:hypothetical protein
VTEHGKISKELSQTEQKIDFLKQKNSIKLLAKEEKALKGLKYQLSSLIKNLQQTNNDKKNIESFILDIESSVSKTQHDITLLNEKKSLINKWDRLNSTKTYIKVDGPVTYNTLIKGSHSEFQVSSAISNIVVTEKKQTETNAENGWVIEIDHIKR